MHRHILIPTDGSELSLNAIEYGMALAKSVNAKVTVLTVSTPFHTFAEIAWSPLTRLWLRSKPVSQRPRLGSE